MTASVPMAYGVALAAVLFVIGLAGVVLRRNLIFMLISTEIMLNAAGLAFVVTGAHVGNALGQVMFLFVLALTAAEVSIALALILQLHQRFKTLDADALRRMRG